MSTETVEVFENIGDNIIEFETKEEFDRYYRHRVFAATFLPILNFLPIFAAKNLFLPKL